MAKIASLVFAILAISSSVSPGQIPWEPCSGTPFGPVTGIAVGSDGNIYVILTYSSYDYGPYAGGIYKLDSTTNRWQWLTAQRFYQAEYFSCIALDSSGALYTSAFPDFPYCLNASGKSWRRISGNLPQDAETSSPEINVFVCGRNGLIYAGMDNGVFRSSNQGISWTPADSGLGDDTTVAHLAVDTGGVLFAATYTELFRSTDSGNFWARIDTGRITAITVDFRNRILMVRGHSLFRSTDHGVSWIDLHVPVPGAATISSVATDRTGRICIGTYTTRGLQSLDDGASWSPFGSNLQDTAFLSLAFSPNGDLFVGTNTSVIKSEDHGKSWNSFGIGIQGAGQLMPLPNGNVIAIGEGGGILEGYAQTFLTTDEGDSWAEYPLGSFSTYCTSSNGTTFVCFDTAVARTTDTGKSWKIVYTEPRRISSLASDKDGDVFMVENYNGIMRSTDNGNSWTIVEPQPDRAAWSNLFFERGNLYASLDSTNLFQVPSLFRSSDKGETWQEVCYALPDRIFAPFGSDSKGNLYLGGSGAVYRSTDSGVTWHRQALTQGSVLGFGTDSEGRIYCGMAGIGPPSIIRSTNNGLTWGEFDLPSFQAAGPFATIGTGRIFVATGAGVFRSLDSGVANVGGRDFQQGLDFDLAPNFPNPCTSSTSVAFTLLRPSVVTLTLFDASGCKVEVLAHQYMTSGPQSVAFNRGDLPSGVYFYRLSADGTSETKAMVIE